MAAETLEISRTAGAGGEIHRIARHGIRAVCLAAGAAGHHLTARQANPPGEPGGRAGRRLALNLAGIDKATIERGEWIVAGELPRKKENALLHLFSAAQEQVKYGVTHPIDHKANPLYINFHEYLDMLKDVKSAKCLKMKLFYIFGDPIDIDKFKTAQLQAAALDGNQPHDVSMRNNADEKRA